MPKQRQRCWNGVFDTKKKKLLNTCIKVEFKISILKTWGRWIAIIWQDNIDIILKIAENNLKLE